MSDKQVEYIIDRDEFDVRQNGLVVDLVLTIEKALADAGLPEKKVAQMTAEIGFGVCSVLDNCSEMIFAYDDEDEDRELPLIPSLSFFVDEERTKLLVSPEGSWMHEYVHGHVDLDAPE